ncbi:MAG: DUF2809 domain-containing protein [Clostridia bacterium]|nr:DUF2809 domain-containing protein [Clostridia bacterium]
MRSGRKRIVYGVFVVIVILIGLSTRYGAKFLPDFISLFMGDILWAFMVYLLTGFLFRNLPTIKIATCTMVFSFTIEISQLYHAPWIDTIRSKRLGGLILGYGFLWSDLVCYTIGILLGIFIEKCSFLNKYLFQKRDKR